MLFPLALTLLLALVVLFLLIESMGHERHLRAIPIRIHVNGTRGKSSVVRLIAGGLRAHGTRVFAKVTGSLPRMIMPDGTEYPVHRPGRPNVIEQLRILSVAARGGAEAVVVECMALQPQLQSLSELRLIRATHGVITNAGPDHLDVMGPSTRQVALALMGTCPVAGKLYTADREHRDLFEVACRDRQTELEAVDPDEIASVSEAEMGRFSYVEHRENVALALRVCASLGVPRDVALRGMWEAAPDVGALQEYALDFFGRRILFVSGFAANDPRSTERIWNMTLERHPWAERRIIVLNCRFDRLDRSRQLGEALSRWATADRYLLVGSGTYALARSAVAKGVRPTRLTPLEGAAPEVVFEEILSSCGPATLVLGAGNIGGIGLNLIQYFKNRGQPSNPGHPQFGAAPEQSAYD